MKAIITLGKLQATLTMEGWSCEDAAQEKALNRRFPVTYDGGDPNPLATIATRAAEAFGATVVEVPTVKRIEGRIY